MNQTETIRALEHGAYDDCLMKMYACSGDALAPYRKRFADAVRAFGNEFGADGDIALFSAPGRTELCGNHTDHQGGHVLAGSIHPDIIAVAAKRDNDMIRLRSKDCPIESVDLSDLHPHPEERNTSAALLRGIAARFGELGYSVTGFDAYTVSDVPRGSGLSSSAAFEVLAGNICSSFFAEGTVDDIQIARIGQYAENVYFGKPCGLMDQMACAIGGIIAIDFSGQPPVVTRMEVDFSEYGYALCILDSGADHTDLTNAYAAIPAEMHAVAEFLGCQLLSEAKKDDFLAHLPMIRKSCGDRAVLRALHYFTDDERVIKAALSLKSGHFLQYLEVIRASGNSSFRYLQNISDFSDTTRQEVAVAIAVCETLLARRGAVRVHGGGFAGTIQAYVPLDMLEEFQRNTEAVLGNRCCHVLRIRSVGGLQVQ